MATRRGCGGYIDRYFTTCSMDGREESRKGDGEHIMAWAIGCDVDAELKTDTRED